MTVPFDQTPGQNEDFQVELAEWLESIDSIYARYGEQGVQYLLEVLGRRALALDVPLEGAVQGTPYVNTIPASRSRLTPAT